MRLGELEQRLREALSVPLPGLEAQLRLAPEHRRVLPPVAEEQLRHAAALLLLYPVEDAPHLLLTVRSSSLPTHSGQVSLPGGAVEPGEAIEEAALREAHEEVGLDPQVVRLLGVLTPLAIPVSRFKLHAVVGVANARPALRPHDVEVRRILEVSLDRLLDHASLRFGQRPVDGALYRIPYFHIAGEQVWGATAMILAEFLWILGWRPPEDAGRIPVDEIPGIPPR